MCFFNFCKQLPLIVVLCLPPISYCAKNDFRPLSKLAVTPVHKDSSTIATKQFAETVEFRKRSITKLYQELLTHPTQHLPERINFISAYFLGKPYFLTALGEGTYDKFDEFPLYRTDAFDCETYVDTILALALAKDLREFETLIKRIRYKNGNVSYINRNHFTGLDWNVNNQQQGFLKDITFSFHDNNNKPVAKIAKAFINKKAWYTKHTLSKIRIHSEDDNVKLKRLAELKKLGQQLKNEYEIISYIPLVTLFDQHSNPNHYIFKQIPQGAIIEIIRPNWDLVSKIGSHLNVSHLGFAIWKNNELFFRQASSENQKVVEVSMIDYLRECLKSPTIKGINIQIAQSQNTSLITKLID